MKRVTLLAAVILAIALCGCSRPEMAYTAKAQGYGGPVTIVLKVAEGRITSITAEGDQETPEIGGAAITTYNKDVLTGFYETPIADANFDEMDVISGATVTSTAVIEALKTAQGQVR